MTKKTESSYNMLVANCQRPTFGSFLQSDQTLHNSPVQKDDENSSRTSSSSNSSGDASPNYCLSPRSHPSPYVKSPWVIPSPIINNKPNNNGFIGTIVREEGHVYSLATSSDLLYTGSDSKNIRVWKNLKEFTGFKSNSGLVKAIVIYGERIFTGHQDGKIRVWKVSTANPGFHKQIGSLPSRKDYVKSCLSPKKKTESIKHRDVVSCLGLNEEEGLLYSGSWDKTLKVWHISNYRCLESIAAHGDAINSVVVGFNSLVFTGSADGTVKAWKKETEGKRMKHSLVETLLKQESAITALAVNKGSRVLYSGSSDGLVNFWELREKQLCHGGVLRGHKMAVLCLASAGNLVVSGSADKSICVWKREIGGVHVCWSVLSGHNGPVKCLAIEQDRNDNNNKAKNPQQWILYSGSLDKSVKVWRMSEYVPMRFHEEYQSPRTAHSSPTKNKRSAS